MKKVKSIVSLDTGVECVTIISKNIFKWNGMFVTFTVGVMWNIDLLTYSKAKVKNLDRCNNPHMHERSLKYQSDSET